MNTKSNEGSLIKLRLPVFFEIMCFNTIWNCLNDIIFKESIRFSQKKEQPFIINSYEEQGEHMKADIIRKKADGSYKNESTVTLG